MQLKTESETISTWYSGEWYNLQNKNWSKMGSCEIFCYKEILNWVNLYFVCFLEFWMSFDLERTIQVFSASCTWSKALGPCLSNTELITHHTCTTSFTKKSSCVTKMCINLQGCMHMLSSWRGQKHVHMWHLMPFYCTKQEDTRVVTTSALNRNPSYSGDLGSVLIVVLNLVGVGSD